MIAGFDHVVIVVRDFEAGVRNYETLLGATASEAMVRDGAAVATMPLSNVSVELMAPVAAGVGAERLEAALADGEGLKSLVFATADIERAHRRFSRVGLAPEPIRDAEGTPGARVFRLAKERVQGLRLFVMQRGEIVQDAGASDHGVSGVDHIVARTPAPEHAEALFGARLGLDLKLVTTIADRTLMLFRCGDVMLEAVEEATLAQPELWGVTWRVADADAAQARLEREGFNVSEVRAGMRPGTRVFTVRDRTGGVPTLMIEPARPRG
jgi:catechol 2,3-dioxygenase-like lactoylglutathione lyase family enzyme